MLLRQKSPFDGFAYELWDDDATVLYGEFRYAWFSQAKNARLRAYSDNDATKGDIHLTLHAQHFRVRYLHLSRGHLNDIRYTLETVDETVLAQIDVLSKSAGQRLPRIVMTSPIAAELGTAQGWFQKIFVWTDSATRQPTGHIREPSAFSTRRVLAIDLPGLEPAASAFVGIVALMVRY